MNLRIGVVRGRERCMGEGEYLHLGHFRVCGDVTVVLLGELGFSLAEVFAGGVEGGIGHACRIEMIIGMFDWRGCKMRDYLNKWDCKLFAN